jgi:nitroimidazol reductase NimA-like FMN-containing flavoprotein (pyridoxamine 5'-phosphate oxidase superfamily)
MTRFEPTAELHPGFSSPDATPTPWADAERQLEDAEIFWLSTVRPDGRPHVTPLLSVWLDGAPYFVTGPSERKAKNLEHNPHCVLTTGCNKLGEGLDLIIEGDAVPVSDEETLKRVADEFAAKYPAPFHFNLRDGAFESDGGKALVFVIRWNKALGFGRGETYSQTRWAAPKT